MCGLMGYISGCQGKPDRDTFMRVAEDTAKRGHHAWGLAWIDKNERLRVYKRNGTILKNLPLAWSMASESLAFILHTRYATHGALDSSNNHPHPVDGGWMIHNGVVQNYRDLLSHTPGLHLLSECDSEVIGRLAEMAKGRLPDRFKTAIDSTSGNLAIAALWHRHNPACVVLARRGNPLHVGREEDGIWFSSNGVGFHSESMKLNTLLEYRYKAGIPLIYRKRSLLDRGIAGRPADSSGRVLEQVQQYGGRIMTGTEFARQHTKTAEQAAAERRNAQIERDTAQVIRGNRITDDDDEPKRSRFQSMTMAELEDYDNLPFKS